ncbi:MAG: ATP-binding protein [Lentisphaerae bacterium]|nr:ATP-binding protein [Lentisphaerota bacterium]
MTETEQNESDSGYFKIRPPSRLIRTIGSELIKDSQAAIIELVKNAYDADASRCEVELSVYSSAEKDGLLKISVHDNGHGMDRDTVIGKWLVPATSSKLVQRVSPGGRQMQGSKGIGRYAASLLGADLLMQTTTSQGEQTRPPSKPHLKQRHFPTESVSDGNA